MIYAVLILFALCIIGGGYVFALGAVKIHKRARAIRRKGG